MKSLPTLFAALPYLSLCALAQEAADNSPLVVQPEKDSLAIAEQLYQHSQDATLSSEERKNTLEKAAALFRDFVRDFPSSDQQARALFFQASCYTQLDKMAEANAILGKLAATQKGEYAAAAAYQLGVQSADRKMLTEAHDYFLITLKNTKKVDLARDTTYRLARVYQQEGKMDLAEKFFSQLILEKDVDGALHAAALYGLAEIKMAAKNDAEAYAYLKQLLAQKDASEQMRATATLHAARLAAKLGKKEQSQQYYSDLRDLEGMEKFYGEALLEQVLSLFQQQEFERLLDLHLHNDIELDAPEKAALYALIIGQTYMELQQYGEARGFFQAAQQIHPYSKTALEAAYREICCAQQLKDKNLFILAEEYLNAYPTYEATKNHPLNDLVRLIYADKMMLVEDEAALRQFEQINIANLPEQLRSDVLYRRAWLSSRSSTNDPIPALNEFIEHYPKHEKLADALALRGEAYAKRGDIDTGIEDFQRVLKQYPSTQAAALSWQRAAFYSKKAKKPKQMIYYYEGLLKYFPRSKPATRAEAYFNMAQTQLSDEAVKDVQLAIANFKKARETSPEKYARFVDIHLVQCYFNMRDHQNLIASLRDLEQSDKDSYAKLPPAIFRWCGWEAFKSKDYQKADYFLSLSLLREPTEEYTNEAGEVLTRPKVEPLIWKSLSRARLEMGLYKKALPAAQHYVSVEQQPYRRAEGMRDLAQILIGLNREQEAIAQAQAAIELGVDGPIKSSLFLALGDAYYSMKQYVDAAKYYGRTANIVNDEQLKPVALYKIIHALKRSGNNQEAQQYEQMLSTQFPDWKASGRMSLFMKHSQP